MLYQYSDPDDPTKVVEVEQKMNEKHRYVVNGRAWDRVFGLPNLKTDGFKHDPFSKKEFLDKTRKTGKVGDLMDRAADWAEERKQKAGRDVIGENYQKESTKRTPSKREKKKI